MALLLAMGGFLALLAVAGLPFIFLGMFGVLIGGGLLVGLHYVTWGWMLSHMREDDEEPPQ